MDCKNEFIKESEKLDKFFDEIQIICEKYGYSISHEDGHGNFFLEDYDEFYMNWFRDASIRVNNKKYDQFYDKWRKYQLEYLFVSEKDCLSDLKIDSSSSDVVSLHSFNEKIESYEIALKYSKEELKEYDRVDRLTIGLAALRLVKREFFPNES